ncbi:MAG TPA: hypothetical protein VII98_09115 [Solirubrobacteraceae bacterium]
MATKDDFSPEDWAALVRAPLVAGLAISIADPGGPIELTKESMAAMKTVLEPVGGDQPELVAAIRADFAAEAADHHSPVKGYKPKSPQEIVDELKRVNGIVSAKATPEEAEGFRALLRTAAQRAAEAAKEGGFLGFGGKELISANEQRMLDEIDAALAPPPAA